MVITFITSQDHWHKGWFLQDDDLNYALKTVQKAGFQVQVKNVVSTDDLHEVLRQLPKQSLLWVNAYYINRPTGEIAWLNDIVEDYGFPIIGSSTTTLKIILAKELCQAAMQKANIPVPDSILVQQEAVEKLSELLATTNLTFPLVVKPTNEGGSLGVKLVHQLSEAQEQVAYIFEHLPGSQVLIEQFLPNDDITCGYIQLGNDYLLLPMHNQIKGASGKTHILARNNHFDPQTRQQKIQTVITEAAILQQICQYVPKISRLFDIRELTRVDGRLDQAGILRFYDINGYPGLRYAKSITVQQCGLFYPDYKEQEVYQGLLNTLLYNASLRYGYDVPQAIKSFNLFTMKSDLVIRNNHERTSILS